MEDRLTKRFVEMVQINSEPRRERQMAEYLCRQLQRLGLEVTEDAAGEKLGGNCGNILARLPGSVPGTILLSAHMDRVEQGRDIVPILEKDRIRTDGSTILAADDVAGLAAILEGIERTLERGEKHCAAEVLFSVCEERGCLGSSVFDSSSLKAKMGFVFDVGGDFGKIVTEAPYKAVVNVEAFGKASHAGAAPEQGVNAVLGMCHMLDGIEDGRLDFESTANLGSICGGGENIGTVCDYVRVQGEARSHELGKLKQYLQRLKKRCGERAEEFGVSCRVGYEIAYPGYRVDDTEEVYKLACSAMRRLGVEPVTARAMGGTDANHLNSRGIACVVIGCGYFQAHSVEEYQKREDLERVAQFVHQVLTQEHSKE